MGIPGMGGPFGVHIPNHEEMAMSETQKGRANWIIDKVLIGVSAFLVIASYNEINESLKGFSEDINELKSNTVLLEWRVRQIENK